MADQAFTVASGFYNSVNKDRLYSAEQMTMPYKRIVADGVFSAPDGTPSTDLQVFESSGMMISVYPGNAMVGGKWFENESAIAITVPSNTSAYGRIDSVILQTNTDLSARAGAVIYRTGTPAATPAAPALQNGDGITELRVANIMVAASASEITQAEIEDTRGTSDCPWVAGVIQQVDTSTLLAQYRAGYQAFLDNMRAEWEAFMDQLQTEYDVTMNLVKLQAIHTSSGSETDIPIGVSGYDPQTDDLQVFINGVHAVRGVHYTIAGDGSKITLANAISAGQVVQFEVFKAVMGGAIAAKYIVEDYAGSSLGGSLQSIKAAIDDLYSRL